MLDHEALQECYYQAQTLTNDAATARRFEAGCGITLYTVWQIAATLAANKCRDGKENILDTYDTFASLVDELNDETRAATIAALRELADSLEARELD